MHTPSLPSSTAHTFVWSAPAPRRRRQPPRAPARRTHRRRWLRIVAASGAPPQPSPLLPRLLTPRSDLPLFGTHERAPTTQQPHTRTQLPPSPYCIHPLPSVPSCHSSSTPGTLHMCASISLLFSSTATLFLHTPLGLQPAPLRRETPFFCVPERQPGDGCIPPPRPRSFARVCVSSDNPTARLSGPIQRAASPALYRHTPFSQIEFLSTYAPTY